MASEGKIPDIVDITIQDNEGRSPFDLACENGYLEIARILLDTAIKRNSLRPNKTAFDNHTKNGETCLSLAIRKGHKEIIETILKNEDYMDLVDINAEITEGEKTVSLKQLAEIIGHQDIAEMFIDPGECTKGGSYE